MSKTIVIDAGHGYNTAGKRCLKSIDPNETREWYLNDRIADMVESELKDNYDCKVLRVDDTTGAKDIGLSARVKTANNAKADFYLSIHHNAGINGGTGGGTVVYYYDKPDNKTRAQVLYDKIVAKTGLIGNRSSKIAVGNFYVINKTTMPALLLENGFMDSKKDTPIILTADHANKTAQGIIDFLVSECKLTKKAAATVAPTTTTTSSSPAAIKVGDTVSIASGATYYTGKAIPSWVIKTQWVVSSIKNDRVVLGKSADGKYSINSPVNAKFLSVAKVSTATVTKNYYPACDKRYSTISTALASIGVDSSYKFRSKIAKANNISGFIGTTTQNTRMLNLLKAGLLIKP